MRADPHWCHLLVCRMSPQVAWGHLPSLTHDNIWIQCCGMGQDGWTKAALPCLWSLTGGSGSVAAGCGQQQRQGGLEMTESLPCSLSQRLGQRAQAGRGQMQSVVRCGQRAQVVSGQMWSGQ